MTTQPNQPDLVASRSAPQVRLPAWLTAPWLWLLLLSSQFMLVQALTGVQYGDAPRNLHWALFTTEHPTFLLDRVHDSYEFHKGFPPDPPELAGPLPGRAEGSTFHPWWGPVPILLWSAVWQLSGSLSLIMLVVPLIAGAVVWVTYGMGRMVLEERAALLAAAFVALFPLFVQHAIISYSEPISALFLALALWAYLRERTLLTVLLGVLVVLCKIDMGFVYGGVLGCALLYRLRFQRDIPHLRHTLLALALPMLALAIWFWLRTGSPLPSGTGRGLSWEIFLILAPEMLKQLLYVSWYGALIVVIILVVAVAYGLRAPTIHGEIRVVLAAWLGFSMVVLLVYTATPGASNSPRVIIPALPALALLTMAGWQRFTLAWKRRTAFYVGVLMIAASALVVYFIAGHMPYLRTHQQVWEALRAQPRGVVMTPNHWETLLHTRQPITWFESNPVFQANITQDFDNFVRYTSQYPIRYVLVPRPPLQTALAGSSLTTEALYGAEPLYSPEVEAYLQANARQIAVPPYYDIYVLP